MESNEKGFEGQNTWKAAWLGYLRVDGWGANKLPLSLFSMTRLGNIKIK